MNFELIDNAVQIALFTCAAMVAMAMAYRGRDWQLLMLALAYGCFAMGTGFWTLHIALTGDIPRAFIVPQMAWLGSWLFLLSLQLRRSDGMRLRFSWCATIPAVIVAASVLLIRMMGPSWITTLPFAATATVLTYLTILRLQERMPGRPTDGMLLLCIGLQLAVYESSSFLELDYTRFNIYFAADIALTLAMVALLPLCRKEGAR